MRWTGNDTRYTLEMSGLVVMTTALLALVNWPPAEGQSVKQSKVVEARVIEASRIVFKDEQGRIRGVVGMSKDGVPGFAFMDAKGVPRAHLEVRAGGEAVFGMIHEGAEDVVRIAVTEGGGAAIRVDAGAGVSILAAPGGHAGISLDAGGGSVSSWTTGPGGKVATRP